MFGKGINKDGEIFDAAVKLGFIEKSGSWFSYKSQRLGQGRDNCLKIVAENPDLQAELLDLVTKVIRKSCR